jgi:hypothetical protein
MFVIYNRPRDFPAHVVVRRHLVGSGWAKPDETPLAVVRTVAEARAALPPGLTCLGRNSADDPCIIEVWV